MKFAFLCTRYGWIPTSSEISREIREEYQWIFPVSITHMEIIHAAYRMHNQNAAFLIRSADFIKDLPPEMTRAFVDTHPLNKAQMKVSLIKKKCLQINHSTMASRYYYDQNPFHSSFHDPLPFVILVRFK